MNSKWYIGALLIILALIGLNQEQTKVANQQIELQFTDLKEASVDSQDDALATITKKLQALGVASIEIIDKPDSQLTIRYYSAIDANTVRAFLSQDNELSLTSEDVDQLPIDFPKEELPETFSLVVSDLQQLEYGLSLNGKFAFELNEDHQRFANPVSFQFCNSIVIDLNAIVKVALKTNNDNAIAIDNSSDTIPEVRAGPIAFGNS